MKKVLFLMFLLFLMVLGTASVKAQVRIGGSGAPNAAAVLDLNKTDTTNTGTKTFALPRVSLTSTTDLLSNTTLLSGMLVYNSGGKLQAGVYYWDGSEWLELANFHNSGPFRAVTWVVTKDTTFDIPALTPGQWYRTTMSGVLRTDLCLVGHVAQPSGSWLANGDDNGIWLVPMGGASACRVWAQCYRALP